MIHPSYVDLMKVVNKDVEEGEEPIISSRYSIVMATARRARQLVAGDEPLVSHVNGRKALSVAVEELSKDKIKILTDEEKEEMMKRIEKEARQDRKHGRRDDSAEAEAPAEEAASEEEETVSTDDEEEE